MTPDFAGVEFFYRRFYFLFANWYRVRIHMVIAEVPNVLENHPFVLVVFTGCKLRFFLSWVKWVFKFVCCCFKMIKFQILYQTSVGVWFGRRTGVLHVKVFLLLIRPFSRHVCVHLCHVLFSYIRFREFFFFLCWNTSQ